MNCWPWSHHWELWTTTEEGVVSRRSDPETKLPYETPMQIGHYLVQQRKCLLCGKVQMRTEKTS